MAIYDYKAGKVRIENILSNKLDVVEQNKLPKDNEFTFDNGYYSWVTSLFVDIRNSSSLFSEEDKEKVSKIIRSFTSEIIEILRDDDNLREIGIRGDCVYAIYTTPQKHNISEIMNKTYYVNTYIGMLNKLLNNKSYPTISVGIGVSTAKELVIKAGRKDVGINSKVWIGDAVTKSSNLSSLGNKNGLRTIVISNCTYINIIDKLVNSCGEKARSWFASHSDSKHGTYYDANLIIPDFEKWVKDGMNE